MKRSNRPFAILCAALAILAVVMYLRACERAQRVDVRR